LLSRFLLSALRLLLCRMRLLFRFLLSALRLLLRWTRLLFRFLLSALRLLLRWTRLLFRLLLGALRLLLRWMRLLFRFLLGVLLRRTSLLLLFLLWLGLLRLFLLFLLRVGDGNGTESQDQNCRTNQSGPEKKFHVVNPHTSREQFAGRCVPAAFVRRNSFGAQHASESRVISIKRRTI
jgi:hypothetical protein